MEAILYRKNNVWKAKLLRLQSEREVQLITKNKVIKVRFIKRTVEGGYDLQTD